MARPRLTDAEREERRKARSRRSFSDAAYSHYDTSKGHGSVEEWMRAAEALSGDRAALLARGPAGTQQDADLGLFGLAEMPEDIGRLKRAFRNSLFVFHPDHGGTDAQAVAAYAAFERLSKSY